MDTLGSAFYMRMRMRMSVGSDTPMRCASTSLKK